MIVHVVCSHSNYKLRSATYCCNSQVILQYDMTVSPSLCVSLILIMLLVQQDQEYLVLEAVHLGAWHHREIVTTVAGTVRSKVCGSGGRLRSTMEALVHIAYDRISEDIILLYDAMCAYKEVSAGTGVIECLCVCCVCVFSSHLFCMSSSLDVPAGVTQEEGHTGFLIHLRSAVHAFIFLARRIQPFLSLVDLEVEFLCTNDSIVLYLLGIFYFIFIEEKSLLPGFELASQRVRRLRGYQLSYRGDRLYRYPFAIRKCEKLRNAQTQPNQWLQALARERKSDVLERKDHSHSVPTQSTVLTSENKA